MAIPELDLQRIHRWCRGRVPVELHDELRVEADVAARHVTVVEVRPPWDGQGDWTRFPVARLRYTTATGTWTLYWRDRNLRFHEYRDCRPTTSVQKLLDHVGESGDPIFWG